MTGLEAEALVVVLVVLVGFAIWLIWSNIAGKRRIPERGGSCSICGQFGCMNPLCTTLLQTHLNRIREKQRRLMAELVEPTERALVTAAELAWSDQHVMINDGRRLVGIDRFPTSDHPNQLILLPSPPSPPLFWDEDWEFEPTNPERGDDPWPNIPLVKLLSGFEHARPWAHG